MYKLPFTVLDFLPLRLRVKCIARMPKIWIEEYFDQLGVSISDIFYKKTWSFDFIEHHLRPEHTDMWDHISVWYVLTENFCERNIEWLNFYELYYSQALSKRFYSKHIDRIDWIADESKRRQIKEDLF